MARNFYEAQFNGIGVNAREQLCSLALEHTI